VRELALEKQAIGRAESSPSKGFPLPWTPRLLARPDRPYNRKLNRKFRTPPEHGNLFRPHLRVFQRHEPKRTKRLASRKSCRACRVRRPRKRPPRFTAIDRGDAAVQSSSEADLEPHRSDHRLRSSRPDIVTMQAWS